MALIKCPECGKQISNKAEVCPHCGINLKEKEILLEPLMAKATRFLGTPSY